MRTDGVMITTSSNFQNREFIFAVQWNKVRGSFIIIQAFLKIMHTQKCPSLNRYVVLNKVSTNHRRQIVLATKFCIMTSTIC